MNIGRFVGMLVGTLLLAGCGGGMGMGGPGLSANDETFIQDDPMMGNQINEGTGDVIP